MPEGKAAHTRCVQLGPANECLIFGQPERPAVCSGFQPSRENCGESNEEAMQLLVQLELATRP
jgi:hypothetical protein